MSAIADAATSLGLTIVSETGDKSQLLLIALAARWRRVPVAIGGVVGITAVQLIAVLIGGWLGSNADDRASSIVAIIVGGVFVAIGVVALVSARTPDANGGGADDEAEPTHVAEAPLSWQATAAATAALLFVAELGDKTMFTTAALSAVRSPIAVFLGATAAFALLAAAAVLIGRAFAERIPERALKLVAGVAFVLTGLITIITI